MSSIGTGYDLAASTFSPDGRIFQVEYALKAVESTGLAIGLRGKDGVVLAVEKPIQAKLYELDSNPRIVSVDKHIGFAGSGVYPDIMSLAEFTEKEAQEYYQSYRLTAPVKHLADRCGQYVHMYSLYGAVRPFGCCVLLASYDDNKGPVLHMIDPAGQNFGYYGIAVGRNKQPARTEVEKLKLSALSAKSLLKDAVRIILSTRDETKDKHFTIELSWVGKETNGVHTRIPKDEAEKLIEEVKKELEEADSDEEMAAS